MRVDTTPGSEGVEVMLRYMTVLAVVRTLGFELNGKKRPVKLHMKFFPDSGVWDFGLRGRGKYYIRLVMSRDLQIQKGGIKSSSCMLVIASDKVFKCDVVIESNDVMLGISFRQHGKRKIVATTSYVVCIFYSLNSRTLYLLSSGRHYNPNNAHLNTDESHEA